MAGWLGRGTSGTGTGRGGGGGGDGATSQRRRSAARRRRGGDGGARRGGRGEGRGGGPNTTRRRRRRRPCSAARSSSAAPRTAPHRTAPHRSAPHHHRTAGWLPPRPATLSPLIRRSPTPPRPEAAPLTNLRRRGQWRRALPRPPARGGARSGGQPGGGAPHTRTQQPAEHAKGGPRRAGPAEPAALESWPVARSGSGPGGPRAAAAPLWPSYVARSPESPLLGGAVALVVPVVLVLVLVLVLLVLLCWVLLLLPYCCSPTTALPSCSLSYSPTPADHPPDSPDSDAVQHCSVPCGRSRLADSRRVWSGRRSRSLSRSPWPALAVARVSPSVSPRLDSPPPRRLARPAPLRTAPHRTAPPPAPTFHGRRPALSFSFSPKRGRATASASLRPRPPHARHRARHRASSTLLPSSCSLGSTRPSSAPALAAAADALPWPPASIACPCISIYIDAAVGRVSRRASPYTNAHPRRRSCARADLLVLLRLVLLLFFSSSSSFAFSPVLHDPPRAAIAASGVAIDSERARLSLVGLAYEKGTVPPTRRERRRNADGGPRGLDNEEDTIPQNGAVPAPDADAVAALPNRRLGPVPRLRGAAVVFGMVAGEWEPSLLCGRVTC